MALTLGQAKVDAIKHCNEYSNSGELIEPTDPNYLDLVLKMNPLANTAQMEIAKVAKIPGKMSISQNQIPNQLGLYAFDEVQHFPGNEYPYTAAGSKSFSIEVDGDCTIYFDEQINGTWTPISGTHSIDGATPVSFDGSITVSGLSAAALQEFKNYRGLLTIASASNQVRMKAVPTYPMKSRYRALFAYAFPTAVKVPHCVAYVAYNLPSNCAEFDRMMRTFDQRQYQENQDYILTNDNKVHINWHLTGQFDIHFWKRPTAITADTPDSYEFEVSEDAQSAIPWFMGGYAIFKKNNNLGSRLIQQYYALVSNLTTPKTNTSSEVQNTLFSARPENTLRSQLRV
jgi:hypothetical protein